MGEILNLSQNKNLPFARIIELPLRNTQMLLTVDVLNPAQPPFSHVLNVRTQIEGYEASQGFGFRSYAETFKNIETFTVERAQAIYDELMLKFKEAKAAQKTTDTNTETTTKK